MTSAPFMDVSCSRVLLVHTGQCCLQTTDRLCNVQRSGSSEASGSTLLDDEQRKQNGRPVTWVGGGGLDIK